ncbi:DMT family transporter [Ferrimonas futtsuensis]|uniref:DMT family transporter n=1 Tax=Ferrimonas futtsuensis TaxID=364764 RepID=UPI0004112CA6|nr:DMT family transporter [Ferrimonas futtsuensis]
MNSQAVRGLICALACILLWAAIPVVARFGQASLDHHQFLFWSSLTSLAALFVVGLVSGRIRWLAAYDRREWLTATGLGFLGTYLYYLLLYLGYRQGESMEVLIVQYTWPVMIALLAPLLLKESFSGRQGVAVMLGLMAVVLVLSRGQLSSLSLAQPMLLAWVVLGAFCFALFSVLSKRITLEPVSLTLVYFAVATLASLAGVCRYSSIALPDTGAWPSIVVNGVWINGLSYLMWLFALRTLSASFLATLTLFIPLVAAGYLVLLGDPFYLVYGLALGLNMLAGWLVSSRRSASAHSY